MGAVAVEVASEAIRKRAPQAASVLLYAAQSISARDDLDDLRSAIRMARRELRAVEALLDEEAR